MINNKQKALLHVAKSQLGLTEEEYREILKAHGGAESSVHLDEFGLEKVMRFFSELGFKRKRGRDAEKARRGDLTILASEGQRKMIYHLMEDLGWWPARLYGFIEKMIGKERPEELTKEEAPKVIEGLRAMRNRKATWN
jgi:hypothetical protein